MTDREHEEAARLILLAEQEPPEVRTAWIRRFAGLPRPDLEAIGRKVAEIKAGGSAPPADGPRMSG